MSKKVDPKNGKCLLVGLGGSGGKVIAQLYDRLIRERGEGFRSNVSCVAIDTDQDELNELAQLGVKKVCISGSGNVGQMINNLEGDVADWCPNTANEGNFYSSQLFNGASQCRLKSRLCFANFLKDQQNALAQVLEGFMGVSATDEVATEAPPVVYIVSSIAGGTGSGIFIQTALYIKKFFRAYNLDAFVYGMFACPDLYKDKVKVTQLPNIYANAYAVVRELNAFNLICGDETTAAYGGKINLDIEISSKCEGNLFLKNSKGRYGDKPYDVMYFIDRVNSLSKILGGLEKYYEAMANIAYSHLYSDISGEVLSDESNEMDAHSIAPCAIYGSAGAATLRYPFEDIIRYFADHAIRDSFAPGEDVDSVWTVIDAKWKNFVDIKSGEAEAASRAKFDPTPEDRADFFIREFEKDTQSTRRSASVLSFLAPMVKRNDTAAVENLAALIRAKAEQKLNEDYRIANAKAECHLNNLDQRRNAVIKKISQVKAGDETDNVFVAIEEIDEKLERFCRDGLTYADDDAIELANEIFSEDKAIRDAYDESEAGIIKNLLYNSSTHEWVHPVAARYLLYSLRKSMKEEMKKLLANDTVADDLDDFEASLMPRVAKTKSILGTNEDDKGTSNAALLNIRLNKALGKRVATEGVGTYFKDLKRALDTIEKKFVDAMVYFAYYRVLPRLDALIKQYEFFFDNIEEFNKKANAAVNTGAIMHENSKGTVYVCASSQIKETMYEQVAGSINMQTGEIASAIAESLFQAMREKAATKRKKNTVNRKAEIAGVAAYFTTVSDLVAEKVMENGNIEDAVRLNAFDAILREYVLTHPENEEDPENYGKDAAAKNRIDQFVATKLAALTKVAAPFLLYDVEDTYSEMFRKKDEDGNIYDKPKVAKTYRYLSHNAEVDGTIRDMVATVGGQSGTVEDFYKDQAAELPKGKDGQSVQIHYVKSDAVDPFSILCYSTVHCLQPYQIPAFDETRGGAFYQHYADRLAEMQRIQRFSMTPHLDKRWHKPGVMPYVNVAKEVERRLDLGKAFLYALCYGKICIKKINSEAKLVYRDLKRGREDEVIFYKGRSIPANRSNRAMNWLADQETLVEEYAARFDQLVEAEVEGLSKYTETLGGYKSAITNYATILNQLKRNAFRNLSKKSSGKADAAAAPNCIIKFAWELHRAEENELDKDYAELLIQTLCEVIKKYAKAPYNQEDIENEDKGSSAYNNYLEIGKHVTNAFLEEYAKSIGNKRGVKKETEEEAEARRRRNSFGRSDEDLDDDGDELTIKVKGLSEKELQKHESMEWARALLEKAFAE